MNFDEMFERCLKNKLAPDLKEALAAAETYNLVNPNQPSITIPLAANVGVIYNKDLAEFTIRGKCKVNDDREWISSATVFTTRELNSARDQGQLVEYVFEQAKHQMLEAIAEGEIKRLLFPHIK